MNKVILFTTGGTIEKSFSPYTGTLGNHENKVATCIKALWLPGMDIEVIPVLQKDSLVINPEDRELLFNAIRPRLADECPIVVTHGTDTATVTGKFLKEREPSIPVPLVLTGAMVPLGFDHSDGIQNVTESLIVARIVPPGIYLVMHGEVYPIECVEKMPKQARFIWTCEHEAHRHSGRWIWETHNPTINPANERARLHSTTQQSPRKE